MVADGDGSDEYLACIAYKLIRKDYYRNWTPRVVEKTTETAVAGTKLRETYTFAEPGYNVFYSSGPDAALFEGFVVDNDSDPLNSYSADFDTARPLPAGKYMVNEHFQHHSSVICGFKPGVEDKGYTTYNVTVTAPSGTLHEAFFDPTEVGTGDVSPAAFTVGGTATVITGLEWSSNNVVLTLDPHLPLNGYVLDFIELDGSVSLSLPADKATVDSAAGTLSWSMTSQPWENGDQPMLRIREVGTKIFLQGLVSTIEQGAVNLFTAKLVNLDASRSYSYRLTADNSNVAFHNSHCRTSPVNTAVPAGETSYSREHALLGCETPGATVTATLLEGTAEVATTTRAVTVTPPLPPSVEIQSW